MKPLIEITNLSKVYASGAYALRDVNLEISAGEIFALLGENGAGKTTLISIVCGAVNASSGAVNIDGHDIVRQYRATRSQIGLVPQELTIDAFTTVRRTVEFSRGLFGQAADPAYVDELLKKLSLYDKRDATLYSLSGGMKRRVLIAKALAHQPRILFLDEPTAGVDVELRKEMWATIRSLQETGVTIILTTHYIEEAEYMADRIGIIKSGEVILVEDKSSLMSRMGKKQLILQLSERLEQVPESLAKYGLELRNDFQELVYTYNINLPRTGITTLFQELRSHGITFRDLRTDQSSLEDIFVDLVSGHDHPN